MKAVQTRSPIHLAYEYANLNNVIVSIWVSDSSNIDSTTTPDYQLNSQAINNFATVEISELIRSKNDYIFNPDFYTKRDTAKYVLVKAILLDDNQTQLEVKYDFLRARDGYLRRVNGVTDKELPQIYKNLIPTDVRDWNANTNVTITPNQIDPFKGSDAYLVEDTNDDFFIQLKNTQEIKGLYTFSVSIEKNIDEKFLISFENASGSSVSFDLSNGTCFNVGFNILSYDIFEIEGYFLCSISAEVDATGVIIGSLDSSNNALPQSVNVFNPTLISGNLNNNDANDLILQDNKVIYTDGIINTKIGFDNKKRNLSYFYTQDLRPFFGSLNLIQSVFIHVVSADLIYDQLDATVTTQSITLKELNECKHTATKVSFVNRFGVIQDLVFFKKRTDSIDTNKESYKTNVLQQGNYYSHIGQTQTIRKESKRSVTLNSGFYPEEFNTVFEQLQNSLHYWIDDEPAVLEGSSFNVKTRVNDKLINYTFDFKYSNEEVNTI